MRKLSFLFTLLFVSVCFSTEYFVSNNTDISNAMNSAQPGDTLTMLNGNWRDQLITFSGNGTEQQPILLRAETPGKVKITGRSSLKIDGTWLVVDGLYFVNGYSSIGAVIEFRGSSVSHNCRLTNTAIVDFSRTSITNDDKWVSIYGTNNRVDHCYFKGKTNDGTTLVVWLVTGGDPVYHRIDHNYFAERPELGFNGGETIRIGTSTRSMQNANVTIESNYFEHCDGETEIISNKSGENIFRYNTFYESEGTLTLRHGNRAQVYNNFFIGNGNSRAGGVRIIGEDHLVYNNYFEGLNGTGFRAALPILNGVPNSPLNRYFQVKRAKVINNTFVNCAQNIVLGAGSDSELSLPPLDCLIANNAVSSNAGGPIVNVVDEPINLQWASNVFWGSSLGIDSVGGISWADPLLNNAEDGLDRPSAESPLINAALDTFTFVMNDMDGQARDSLPDIGADEFSADEIIYRPLTADDVGLNWPLPNRSFAVQEGLNSLRDAFSATMPGDTLVLISDGGIYESHFPVELTHSIIIMALPGLASKPQIRNSAAFITEKQVFAIEGPGHYGFDGLVINGLKEYNYPSKDLILINHDLSVLDINNCTFDGVGYNDGAFISGNNAIDTLLINNSLFYNSKGKGIMLADTASGSETIMLSENNTFWNIDDVPMDLTGFSSVNINHNTFDSCATITPIFARFTNSDTISIKNSMITNNGQDSLVIYADESGVWLDYINLFNIGLFPETGLNIGANFNTLDPQYLDQSAGNLSLDQSSPVRGLAQDGFSLGDLRWENFVTKLGNANSITLADEFELWQNYPNPFNPNTIIRYRLSKADHVQLFVYDLSGKLVQVLENARKNVGTYEVEFSGNKLSSGVYFYTLKMGNYVKTMKMVLLK